MKLVKQYLITYLDALGNVTKASIVAHNKNDALRKLDIATHNYISSTITYKLNSAIAINVQLQILTRILGGVQSGEHMGNYLPEIINDFRELKSKTNYINRLITEGKNLSQILSALDLNESVHHIIASGEISGNIAQSLKTAKDLLRLDKQVKKATSSTFKAESIKLITAFLLLFLAPIGVVYFFDYMQSLSLQMPKNFSTEILFILNNINIYLFLMLSGLITFYFTNKKLVLNFLSKIYPFSIFVDIKKTKDSILFLSIFTPLYKVSAKTEQIIQSYKNTDYDKALNIDNKIKQGISIADAVQDLPYSATFKQSFKGFNRISDKTSKQELLQELFLSLQDDIEVISSHAAMFITALSNIMIWGMLIVLLHGFMIPQLGMGVAI